MPRIYDSLITFSDTVTITIDKNIMQTDPGITPASILVDKCLYVDIDII